jgi:hypothetical protein
MKWIRRTFHSPKGRKMADQRRDDSVVPSVSAAGGTEIGEQSEDMITGGNTRVNSVDTDAIEDLVGCVSLEAHYGTIDRALAASAAATKALRDALMRWDAATTESEKELTKIDIERLRTEADQLKAQLNSRLQELNTLRQFKAEPVRKMRLSQYARAALQIVRNTITK